MKITEVELLSADLEGRKNSMPKQWVSKWSLRVLKT